MIILFQIRDKNINAALQKVLEHENIRLAVRSISIDVGYIQSNFKVIIPPEKWYRLEHRCKELKMHPEVTDARWSLCDLLEKIVVTLWIKMMMSEIKTV